ncbi:hypothetical protein [Photobacterium damselae]|uniref:hypothetical protein n=1 Tax=Photobacterium damselae TaxID=38293 RepID=UPI001F28023E|nr:hypothetical protein [Photobacterium damselae]UKA12956.1 hypothetical protein IHC91_21465 [Photobacterium damselae subsp. damselae]
MPNSKKPEIKTKNTKRTINVQSRIVDWFAFNLDKTQTDKNALAKYCDVSRQAVHKWITTGIISKDNLIMCSRYFKTVPPLDLMSDKRIMLPCNPLDYHWSQEGRRAIEIIKKLDDERINPIQMNLIASIVEAVESLSSMGNNSLKEVQAFEWECNNRTRALMMELDGALSDYELPPIIFDNLDNKIIGRITIPDEINGEYKEAVCAMVAYPVLTPANIEHVIQYTKDLLAYQPNGARVYIVIDGNDDEDCLYRLGDLLRNTLFTKTERKFLGDYYPLLKKIR